MTEQIMKLFAMIIAATLITHQAVADEKEETAERKPGITAPGVAQQIPSPMHPAAMHPEGIDPAAIRASMKARAEYDSLNRQVTARRQKLYEENETVKKLQANMRELQKRIDEILEEDEELVTLKEKLDSFSPQMPFGIERKEPQPVHFAPPTQK